MMPALARHTFLRGLLAAAVGFESDQHRWATTSDRGASTGTLATDFPRVEGQLLTATV